MKKYKSVVWMLVLAALCMSLAGCGETPREAGRYNCVGYIYDGVRIADSSYAETGTYIKLGGSGRGVFSHDGQAGEISWFSGGEYIELRFGDKSYEGSIKNGVITLGIADNLSVLFRWDKLPQETIGELSQDYYGWWQIKNPTAEMPETWIDCFARIEFRDGQPRFIIWDEDGSAAEPMGKAVLEQKNGVFTNTDGSFWYSKLEPGQWELTTDGGKFEDVLSLKGTAQDRNGESFEYSVFLRPWGRVWDDVEAERPKYLPYHYEDWYLPLIEANKPMPDSMDIK